MAEQDPTVSSSGICNYIDSDDIISIYSSSEDESEIEVVPDQEEPVNNHSRIIQYLARDIRYKYIRLFGRNKFFKALFGLRPQDKFNYKALFELKYSQS